MAKPGPKAKRADGFHVTRKGYLRGIVDGRLKLQHVAVWERHRGPIPDGCQLHHINGDRQDNRLSNLQLVTPTEHKRLHSGCELRDGEWFKPCPVCGGMFPITTGHFYLSPEGWPLYGRCRRCHIAIVVRDKRLRNLRKRSQKNSASDAKA